MNIYDLRLSFAALTALAALALGAPACGGGGDDDGPGSGSESAALTARYCDGRRSGYQVCRTPEEQASEYEECREKGGACLVALARPELIEPVAKCLEGLGCSNAQGCQCAKSDDTCFREAGQAAPASAARDEYERTCKARLAACENGFSNDYCTDGDVPWRLFSDSTFQSITPCFEKACGEVSACISAAFNTVSGGACSN